MICVDGQILKPQNFNFQFINANSESWTLDPNTQKWFCGRVQCRNSGRGALRVRAWWSRVLGFK